MKKRHLKDLYVTGRVVTLNDGDSEAEFFLKKLNLVENETAVRNANAVRARLINQARDVDSDLYQIALAEVNLAPRENLVDLIIARDLVKARESAEAEIASHDEWAKEDYLQGLLDAWAAGLGDAYIKEGDTNEEAARVYVAISEFTKQVEDATEMAARGFRADYEHVADEDVRNKALQQLLDNRADLAWVEAFRREELFLAVRDTEDIHKQYFDSIDDLKLIEAETLITLLREYRDIAVEPAEGKDLQPTPSS